MMRALIAILLAGTLSACEITNSGDELTGPDTEQTVAAEQLPVPTGTFNVGTTVMHVIDASRDDGYTAEVQGDPRELMVQVWYPTDQTSGVTADYMDPTVASLFSVTQDYVAADTLIEFLSALKTNSFVDAPVASSGGPYPVVFYSHGLAGVRALYTTFVEDLASHGYVVVGIDHTYGAFATVFPDGRVASIRTINAPEFPEIVDIWAADMSSVLGEMESLNASDPSGRFTGRLDLAHVGATGHSTGGSASMQALMTDSRFTAGMSLDAPQVGDAADGTGLNAPALLFFASPSDYEATLIQDRMRVGGYTVSVAQTSHYSFTDLPKLLSLAGVDPAVSSASSRPPGLIDADTNLAIINGYTLDFFERYLAGRSAPLLDGSGGWAEATLSYVTPGTVAFR